MRRDSDRLVVRAIYDGVEITVEDLDEDDDPQARLTYWSANQNHDLTDVHVARRTVEFVRVGTDGGVAPATVVSVHDD